MEPDGALLHLHPCAQYPGLRALHGLSRQVPYLALRALAAHLNFVQAALAHSGPLARFRAPFAVSNKHKWPDRKFLLSLVGQISGTPSSSHNPLNARGPAIV